MNEPAELLVYIQVSKTGDGLFEAAAPKLPELCVSGQTLPQTLAKARLKIEALITARLDRKGALPTSEAGKPPPNGDGWYPMDINVGHLIALSAHQTAAGQSRENNKKGLKAGAKTN